MDINQNEINIELQQTTETQVVLKFNTTNLIATTRLLEAVHKELSRNKLTLSFLGEIERLTDGES